MVTYSKNEFNLPNKNSQVFEAKILGIVKVKDIDINHTDKSLLLTQIEKYSVGDNTDLPKYVPHCNVHKVHQSFMKRQGTSLENEDNSLLGSDVWYNGKDWDDTDL